jgi:isoleucyl-tRNA synthetase
MTNSPPWRPTLFDEEGMIEVQRKFFGTLINTYSFFALYANIDSFNFKAADIPYPERPEIDRWIISQLNSLVKEYTEFMDAYDITKAARAISNFTIDHLSNWYIRRCRRRFWKSEMNANKTSAYQTLYECLITVVKLTSPFAPFISEEIFRNLNSVTGKEKSESVHLSSLPIEGYREPELEDKMEIAQRVVYLTRAMRAKNNLKVRQPLNKMMVFVEESKREALLNMKDVILEEVNIRNLIVLDDDSGIVSKSAKGNFRSIGPKYGKKVNLVANAIKTLGNEEIKSLEKGIEITINFNGENFTISKEDVEIISSEITGWVVENEEGVTAAIDTELNDELIAEGLAREFVNRVQNMRKDAGYNVIDKININFTGSPEIMQAVLSHKVYITNETLAEKLLNNNYFNNCFKQDWKINDFDCTICIEKVKS